MLVTMFKSKIHRATVTEANLNYMGSITVDSELLKASDILVHEKVQVVNLNNGSRLETYVIPGAPNSGVVCLNGAAARLAQPGDKVIIISYALMEREKAEQYKPLVVMVDDQNCITEIRKAELPGRES
ncbi:aspartate 1-decarboxylase [Desulfohalotomaculum tongense]|uniref:aspartate 1-decarboxylase n=1 Tax=Desulforadius tongensis TaxID=1216062 RepID=UPI0019598214|nr:aspartate 1-decarboxylase [Desulforadius tongensis]MBM7856035.1 aspartate 1-decarboxylase [Desulforadius tongensis]